MNAAQPATATPPTSGGGRPTKYRLRDGKIVPGVTTIAGAYKDPGPLMHWAWTLGTEGRDYRQERDSAGSVGHIVHGWIEDSIHNRSLRVVTCEPDMLERAQRGFEAFLDWRQGVHLQVVDTERPLVSELHAFGGTYDALALVNGRLSLLDWKSGSGVYPEVLAQLAGYRQLIRESVGNKRDLAPDDAHCLRVGKEHGDFHHHHYPSAILDAGWRRFLGARAMYDEDKMLKKVCT